jgi:hypothetical protein
MKYDKQAYETLLDKVEQVFGNELDTMSETQEAVVDALLEDRINARGGDPSKVTLDEVLEAPIKSDEMFLIINADPFEGKFP